MDRFPHSAPSLDELRQIQYEARASQSLRTLRGYFDRVQELRRIYSGDFDVQLQIAEAQDYIIQRARELQRHSPASGAFEDEPNSEWGQPEHPVSPAELPSEVAEIPPEVPRIDKRSWRMATFLALFLTTAICVAFFYLIQSARKLNLSPPETTVRKTPAATTPQQPASGTPAAVTPPPASTPTLRMYTDLVPGTVSIDDGEPQDLKEGELVLDHLEPGRHSIKVAGRSGAASFSFDVDGDAAPQVVGLPTATNALTVLVSAQDGKGRLISSTQPAQVTMDGKVVGEAGTEALALDGLGTTDHDLLVGQGKDRQRFVLTYTPSPVLTVYIKSDPNAGTVVVNAKQDGAIVLIDGKPYRRKTDHGQVRIPLKVGTYSITVHKDGFVDPPAQSVDVKKAEESALDFNLTPVPNIAELDIRGAAPGTAIYVDGLLVGTAAANGSASISNIKSGNHEVELRLDGLTPKKFERTFQTGETVQLAGTDVVLEKPASSIPLPAPPSNANETTPTAPPSPSTDSGAERIQKGGGFVQYSTPKASGHYTFQAHSRIGGFLKHGKLQWYAGYQDSQNFVLFTVDGKHAIIRQMVNGKSNEVSRLPFTANSGEWVQVDMAVKAGSVSARIRTPDTAWYDMGSASSQGQDFTQGKVGFYLPGNEEVAVTGFHFSSHP